MDIEPNDQRLEGMRAVLWAITRVLDRDTRPSAAACFEVRTLAHAGLQLADAYFDSLPPTAGQDIHPACKP